MLLAANGSKDDEPPSVNTLCPAAEGAMLQPGLIRVLVIWGDALYLSLLIHHLLSVPESLAHTAARLRDAEGSGRFN
jgi:hypothetical protein